MHCPRCHSREGDSVVLVHVHLGFLQGLRKNGSSSMVLWLIANTKRPARKEHSRNQWWDGLEEDLCGPVFRSVDLAY